MLRTVGGWVNFWIAVAMFITTLLHVCVTQEKRRFFKVFKVAGKIFITTVSKKNVQKKGDEGPWWISPTKSSTIR